MGSPKAATSRVPMVRAAATVICWPSTARTASSWAIQRARDTQPVAQWKVAVQGCVDGDRIGVQVEHGTNPADDHRQRRRERIAHRQKDLLAIGVEAKLQPARMRARALRDAQGACKGAGRHRLDAAQGAALEEVPSMAAVS